MSYQHSSLADGRWQTLSLTEQLGNISSEISRAAQWQKKDSAIFRGVVERALELFDLTARDSRWRYRLKEILRARELFLDAVYEGKNYGGTLEELEQYFFLFALAARASL